ncbi:MAG: ABC transporter permease subunit [Chloroflexi bacterium]|nr:ABC transporter permease subunit [Chloroflexota bacterium]
MDQYVKNISQFGVILALLLTMGAVAQEKSRGTAAMILVKPLPRTIFLLAKFSALALMFAFALALAAAACFYYTLLLFGTLDLPHWLGLNALLLLFILVYVALTLFCSVVAKSQAAAGGFALFFLFILGLAGAIPGLGNYLPGHLLVWGRELMMGGSNPAWPALGISLVLIVLSLVGASVIFQQQEL